ncbi:MFS transporter [Fodinisporobacter ferrooxydans]|uniref:MFS transporter n=1 Tax=Fodinisporobacter ferrooxydans TaxID=2901836 RepID=A0ABY4CNF7_9BACL|nr:MFS transporter [Alicyclobacillaceae bacterium MYW30-H2]
MAKPLGLRNDETIRSIAGRSKAYFVLIVMVSVIPGFLEGFDGSLFQFAAPYVVQNIQAAPAMLGVLATGYAVGMALFSMIGGILFDKFSVKYTILISVTIFAVFTLVSGLARSLATLIIARLLVGIGIGMFQPAIIAFLGDIFPKTRSRSISVFGVIYGAGIFFAPYIISPFLPHIQVPFVISGILAVLSLVAFYLIVPKTYKKVEKHRIGMKGILNKNVCILSVAILLYGISLFGYLGFYSQYLLKVQSIHPIQAAAISSMYGLGALISTFPIGMLADKIGRKHVVRLASLLLLISGVGMFSVGRDLTALSIFTFVFGAGNGFVGLAAALGQDSVKEQLTGIVTGWLFFLFNIGAMLGGPVFAAFLPIGFVKSGIVTLGVSSLLSFILTLFAGSGVQTRTVSTPDPTRINN